MSTASDCSAIRTLDSHIHFTDLDQFDYDYLTDEGFRMQTLKGTGVEEETMYFSRNWSEADLKKVISKNPQFDVVGCVFVEAAVPAEKAVDEAVWALSMAASPSSLVEAVVAQIPVPSGEEAVTEFLRSVEKRGGAMGKLRGGRVVLFGQPLGAPMEPKYQAGLQLLGAHNLLWEFAGNPKNLPGILNAVKGCPSTTFVLNHCLMNGGLTNLQGGFEEYKGYITELGKCPNVYVKLGAQEEWNEEPQSIQNILHHVLTSFGYDRCLAESNWFVSNGKGWANSLRAVLSVLKAQNAPPEAVQAVFELNAAKLYGVSSKNSLSSNL